MEAQTWDRCLGMIGYGSARLKQGDFDNAKRALAAVLVETKAFAPADARDVKTLALYNLSLMLSKQGQADQSAQLRESVSATLEPADSRERPVAYLAMLGDVLTDLGACRQAIPYYEECVKGLLDSSDPLPIADVLWRAGKCYATCGLPDHAAIPLRAAAKVFRQRPEDPRFPSVLLSLGNAVRKSSPKDADACYQEAAQVWTNRGHLESATAAWVNLGVLCSEQERLTEALDYYTRALQIRQSSPGTPAERLGSLHNNIANCYRRMRDFEQAQESVETALSFLEAIDAPVLGSAYGTQGLILRDQGNDEQAVLWFHKATSFLDTDPPRNVQTLIEDLEYEAAALKRLGRETEAAAAIERAAKLTDTADSVAKFSHDVSDLGAASPGAVFIEMPFGLRSREGRRGLNAVSDRLRKLVYEAAAGRYGGTVATPESCSVMFYGDDAEAMYRVLSPELIREPLCRGARITIRQGASQRELMLPGPVMEIKAF